jgi:hypothetical protein
MHYDVLSGSQYFFPDLVENVILYLNFDVYPEGKEGKNINGHLMLDFTVLIVVFWINK